MIPLRVTQRYPYLLTNAISKPIINTMSAPYTYILAEKDGQSVKIPQQEFDNSFVSYVPEPASPLSEGQQGDFSANDWTATASQSISSSAFVYSNNAWRKIPTYTLHWEDIEPLQGEDGSISYLRFLPVHKEIELSAEEKANVRRSLNLNIASEDYDGTIKPTGELSEAFGSITVDPDTGHTKVVNASLANAGTVVLHEELLEGQTEINPIVYTKAEIDKYIDNTTNTLMPIRPAGRDNLGSVMIGPSLDIDADGTINTFKADINTSGYGNVRYVSNSYANTYLNSNFVTDPENIFQEQHDYTLSAHQIENYVTKRIQYQLSMYTVDIQPATSSKLGGVKVTTTPNSALNVDSSGNLTLQHANADRYGSVKFVSSIPDTVDQSSTVNFTVPTMAALVQYVKNKVTTQLPVATKTTKGIVSVGEGLVVNNGELSVNVPIASSGSNTPGIVYVTTDIANNNTDGLLPTAAAVVRYIKTNGSGNSGTTVSPANVGSPGTVAVEVSPSDTMSGGYYTVPTVNRVRQLINSGNGQTYATPYQAGAVKLSITSADQDFSNAQIVPTVNKVQQMIDSAIENGGGGSDSGDSLPDTSFEGERSSKVWLVIGTGELDINQIKKGANDYGVTILNTIFDTGDNLIKHHIFSFAQSVAYTQIKFIVKSTTAGSTDVYEDTQHTKLTNENNFIYIAAEGATGSFLLGGK